MIDFYNMGGDCVKICKTIFFNNFDKFQFEEIASIKHDCAWELDWFEIADKPVEFRAFFLFILINKNIQKIAKTENCEPFLTKNTIFRRIKNHITRKTNLFLRQLFVDKKTISSRNSKKHQINNFTKMSQPAHNFIIVRRNHAES